MHARAVALMPRAQAVWLEGATDFVAEQEPAQRLHLQALVDAYTSREEGDGSPPARG